MTNVNEIERYNLRNSIIRALSIVYEKDKALLADEINVCERSLMHRFTHYFMDIIEGGVLPQWRGLNVDGEYNREFDESMDRFVAKELSKSCVYPDVILHKRGDNSCNLCVIEFKKAGKNANSSRDKEKLKGLTHPNGKFKYKYGIYIEFHVKGHDGAGLHGVTMEWFINGRPVSNEPEKETLPQKTVL